MGRPLAVFVVTAVAFALRADPGVGFGDAGEIGASAATLGVAHPTGFPLVLVWLKAFELIPLGPVAFRQSLACALAAAGALAVLFDLVRRLTHDEVGGWVAAFGLGGWATFGQAAIGVEAYAFVVLLFALAAHEGLVGRRPAVLALWVGLSAGVHVAAVLTTAAMALPVLARRLRRPQWTLLGFVGAAVLLYLPIASARNPAMDWGDPETFGRLLDHLTAGRIRSAFEDVDPERGPFLDQLLELTPWIALSIFGWVRGPTKLRWLLVPLGIDLWLSLAINPMGIVDRQVGHVTGACIVIAAGVGAGLGLRALARDLPGRVLATGGVAVLLLASAWSYRSVEGAGWGVEECFAAGLRRAPARSVLVCGGSDDGCAVTLFQRHALGIRPDVDVLVPQHLWEPNERARLGATAAPIPVLADRTQRPHAPEDRARLALEAEAALHGPALGRRVVRQAWPTIRLAAKPMPTAGGTLVMRIDGDVWDAVERFAHLAEVAAPREWRARKVWAQQLDTLGRGALGREQPRAAAAAFRKALMVAPERGAGWTNLGVALAAAGDVRGAIDACTESIAREPLRATAWVNLTRYQLGLRDLSAARGTLQNAAAHGVVDPRLDALRQQTGLP